MIDPEPTNPRAITFGVDPDTREPLQLPVPAGLHDYDQKTRVGNTRLGASAEAAFEALRRNATPWQGNVRIDRTGDVTDIPGFGAVRHVVFPDQMIIVNTTMDNHWLHPGNVHRKIVQDGDDIYVVTKGYGQGIVPGLNKAYAPGFWERHVDQDIRDALNPPPSYADAFANTTDQDVREQGGYVGDAVRDNQADAARARAIYRQRLAPRAPGFSAYPAQDLNQESQAGTLLDAVTGQRSTVPPEDSDANAGPPFDERLAALDRALQARGIDPR